MLKKLLAAAPLLVLLVHAHAADNPKEQAARFYEDAERQFNAEEFDVAIIQLKNALQQDPYMLPALVLLGSAYVETGNGAAAETALNKALQLGADPAITVVPLAKAYVQQFKHNQLLNQAVPDGLPLMVHAELLTVMAGAAMEVDDVKALEALLNEVERYDPGSLEAINMRATRALLANEFKKAGRLVEKLGVLAPGDPQTYMLAASLHHRQGEAEEALADYGKVIEINPQDRAARIARVSILLALKRWEDAEPDFEALAEIAPFDPRVDYLRAVKLGGAGDDYGMNSALNDAANAIEALGETAVSRNSQLLMVGGIVNFRLENFEKAQTYLSAYSAGHPDDINAATMLATVLIRKGEFAPAVKLLEPIVREQTVSPQLLTLLAQAYSGAERHNKATAILERAAAMRPNDAAIATKLAVARANRGQMDTALADLANVFENSNYEPVAGLRLATLHLNRGEVEQARAVAEVLHKQDPDNLTFLNLLGITEVGLNRLDAGRILFERALELDPDFSPGRLNLAKIDRLQGNYLAAESIYNQLLSDDPTNAKLMLELARTSEAAGDRKQALIWARDAVAADRESFEIAGFLIDLYLKEKDYEAAANLAYEQEKLYPENLYVLGKQLTILDAQQDFANMRTVLKRMAAAARFDVDWLLEIGDRQAYAGYPNDAHYSFSKVLQADPYNLKAQFWLGELELKMGKPGDAHKRAVTILERYPDSGFGYLMLGNVQAARRQFADAVQSFRDAMDRDPRADTALKLHQALRFAGEADAAETVLKNWLKNEPDAMWAQEALADHYRQVGKLKLAQQHYERFLKRQPRDAGANNNLAIVLQKMDQPDAALRTARRAYELAPENPLINDTLGWLLVNTGDVEEGLRFLREARARAAYLPEIRYHLAVALGKQGRTDEALAEVEAALKSERPFEGRADARTLAERLRTDKA